MAKKFRPKFAGGGVKFEGVMNSPTGSGLAKRSMGHDNTVSSQSDSDLEDLGMNNDLVNKLIETDAMCDVDENGVENKPQGVKTPGHSQAKDGYTKPLSSNLSNGIAESTEESVDEEFKEGAPLPTVDYNDGEGMEVSNAGGHSLNEEEGEMTLEEAFEQYANNQDEINYNSFSQHCGELGYECPTAQDMDDVMANDPYNMYEQNEVGGYYRVPIMLSISVDDLPSSNKSMPDEAPNISFGPEDVDVDSDMDSDSDSDEENDSDEEIVQDMASEEQHPEMAQECDESVTESSVTTAQIAAPPSVKPMIKKGKEMKSGNAASAVKGLKNHGENMNRSVENASDKAGEKLKSSSADKTGNAASAVKGLKNHGESLKRDMKNDDSSNILKESKDGFILPDSIKKNVLKIIKTVNEAVEKVPSSSRCKLEYKVIVESKIDNKKAATKKTVNLTEAAADAEELAVIGEANTKIEVSLLENNEQIGAILVQMPKLNTRQPAINESGMLFRFKSLAERYAAVTITESAYQVKDHPYGALVKTEIAI